MAEYEEKFIVINKKRLSELNDEMPQTRHDLTIRSHPAVTELLNALEDFESAYSSNTGKKLDQKYYVVNQDEPYAENVIKFILDNETEKEQKR